MVAPKTPMYQEGGAVADRTKVAQTFIPTESLNLPLANLANPRQSGSVSRAPMTNEEIMQIVMDVATPGAVVGSIGKKKLLPFEDRTVDYFDRISDFMKRFGRDREDAVEEIRSMDMRDRVRKFLRERKSKGTEGPKILENLYGKSGFHVQGYEDKFLQFPKYVFKSDESILERMDLLNQSIESLEQSKKILGPSKSINMRLFGDKKKLQALEDFYTSPGRPQVRTAEGDFKDLDLKQQGGMIQYEEGGPLHSRRMFNQGTGFDKKKSDLNKDGKISEYEKKRGMAIAKSMKNQMQMGGMIGMQQPMMQRPINPAMNLSPMQRMGNNMPPMMYQEGGSILPSQNTLRGIRRDAMSVLDNVGIENLRQAAMDTLMKMDMRPQEERSLFGSGQPVGMRVPETYGPPAPRKQKEMRQKSSDLDELLKGLVIEVNPFTGDTITEQSIKEELERIRRRVEQSKKPNMQEGGMISDSNLMGAMANDRRVAALQPDVYSSRMQNGMTGAEAMVVPKLAEAILPAYGIETPLSRKQGAMLNKNAVSPSALNPNLKGLVNRLLVQRLANETT
jgi:hypothetical protein